MEQSTEYTIMAFLAAFNQAQLHGASLLQSFERIRSLISQVMKIFDSEGQFYFNLLRIAHVFILTKGQKHHRTNHREQKSSVLER